MNENERDQMAADYFRSGWDAAVREAKLRHDAGQDDEFFNEQRRALGKLIPCPHWEPGRITMRTKCTACAPEGVSA